MARLMQIEVRMAILTPDGLPVLGTTRVDCIVSREGDTEGNTLKAAAKLDDLVRDAEASMQSQIRALREAYTDPEPEDGRGRRGRH